MAGYGAYTKVEGFGFLPINSFTMALTTFVGQNLGAKQEERTRKRGAIWNSRSSYIGRTDWCRGISSGTTADRGI